MSDTGDIKLGARTIAVCAYKILADEAMMEGGEEGANQANRLYQLFLTSVDSLIEVIQGTEGMNTVLESSLQTLRERNLQANSA